MNAFQTAVRTNVSTEQRTEAIDRLRQNRELRNLGVIVRMGGLRGQFRRAALDALISCSATGELEAIAEDRSVAPSLRRVAAQNC